MSERVSCKQEGGVSVAVDYYFRILENDERMCTILKLLTSMLLGHSSLCFCFIIL